MVHHILVINLTVGLNMSALCKAGMKILPRVKTAWEQSSLYSTWHEACANNIAFSSRIHSRHSSHHQSHAEKKHAHRHHRVWYCSQENRSLYFYASKYCRRQTAAAKTFGQSASLKDIYSSEQRELMHWFEAERGKWRKSLSQVIACSKTNLLFFWVLLSLWFESHVHISDNNFNLYHDKLRPKARNG